jgi:hypothetical protein
MSPAQRLYPHLDAITAGFQGPAGTVAACDGGYRLSGGAATKMRIWLVGVGIRLRLGCNHSLSVLRCERAKSIVHQRHGCRNMTASSVLDVLVVGR